ncbi:MAG: flavodoxin domain-containing protein, partial [Anaerovoracaceae bacterium]
GEVFDTDISWGKLNQRAGDYYANIVLPFGFPVANLLKQASELEIEIICPSHGVILTERIGDMIGNYLRWSENKTIDNKLLIVYDTMWGTTRKLAEKYEAEYKGKGFQVEKVCLSDEHHSSAMAKLLEAKYIFVGSPTLNNEMMPTVASFLTYMKGLKPKNRIGKAFGSFGWSGESADKIAKILEESGFELLETEKVNWNF